MCSITSTTSTFTLNTFTLANHRLVKNAYKTMEDDNLQVQPMRSVTKSSVDSATLCPPAPTVYIDCHQDPTTKKPIVLWDDIRLAFADALHVRNQARVLPLMPLRIAAIPNVILDVVVDDSIQKTSTPDAPKKATIVDALQVDPTTKHANTAYTNSPKRNPSYGLEETAMDNYSHIDNPATGPQPRAPQYTLNVQQQPLSNPTSHQTKNPITMSTKQAQSHHDHNSGATPKDIAQLTACAVHGDKDAQLCLGDKYRDGDGIEQDYQAAHHWYLRASVDAMKWFHKAANQGDALAQSCMGDMYSFGRGVPRIDATAMKWYLRAADQDLVKAQFMIGIMYENGQGVESNKSVALDWFRKATQRKDTDAWAQFVMGYMYRHGRGVPRDYPKAINWLVKSARQGCTLAQCQLGSIYQEGQGVPQDYTEAMVWFLRAAEQNLPEAQYQVGTFYHYGRGVEEDHIQAKKWYVKAADRGLVLAQRDLHRLQMLIDKERAKTEEKDKWASRRRFW
ncbi:hypothetical protein BGZ91_005663 [Linnemannia elongata]|nr:hypothetical protein BGZ91_005663 [Linnemannia elongata]